MDHWTSRSSVALLLGSLSAVVGLVGWLALRNGDRASVGFFVAVAGLCLWFGAALYRSIATRRLSDEGIHFRDALGCQQFVRWDEVAWIEVRGVAGVGAMDLVVATDIEAFVISLLALRDQLAWIEEIRTRVALAKGRRRPGS
ncbi:MAG: hypothetical protein JNL79_00885 [Myxococcales bacterium]|nr:hypothetical protein [Myxococcales bacterium]